MAVFDKDAFAKIAMQVKARLAAKQQPMYKKRPQGLFLLVLP